MVRVECRGLRRRRTERRVHGALELSHRVSLAFVHLRARIVIFAKVDETWGVWDLLTSSLFLNKEHDVLLDFAILQG